MKTLAYYNGEIAPIDELRIPINDRVCWFGDGVYDATLAKNHVIFALSEHLDRFFNSAALIEIPLSFSKAWLEDLLKELVRKLDSPNQFVYWQATRGTADRVHNFPDTSANLWVMLRPFVLPDLTQKVKLITEEDIRFQLCNIKTLNLLPNVLASERAKRAGCYEAVFHRGERVTECAHSNVHLLKDGVFRTAPTDNLILPGIARAHLIAHCLKLGIPVSETPFTVTELMSADEVIISSSSRFCLSASHINEREVGGKAPELLAKLRESLLNEFHELCAANV
jgi:D-alanine transaminase